VLRASYFVSFGPIDDEIALWPMLLAIVLAVAGTGTRIYVIERMSDHSFRQWTRMIIFSVSGVYVLRADSLFWQG
jgi:uncharacterized protein